MRFSAYIHEQKANTGVIRELIDVTDGFVAIHVSSMDEMDDIN